jgi:hypothetical protein
MPDVTVKWYSVRLQYSVNEPAPQRLPAAGEQGSAASAFPAPPVWRTQFVDTYVKPLKPVDWLS